MAIGEIAKKGLEHRFLIFCQIGDIIKLMYVADVGKHLAGIGHILVYIIKVRQHHLSPRKELIEGFNRLGYRHITLMKVADQLQTVGLLILTMTEKHVGDSGVDGAPQWGSAISLNQILI